MRHGEVVKKPIVQRTVNLKLQCAQRMGDPFDRVRLTVCPVVGRVDAPLISGAGMGRVHDAVHHRIAHIQVGMAHINLGTQGFRPVGKLARTHPPEQIEVLFHRPISVRAVLPRRSDNLVSVVDCLATVLADLLRGQVINVRFALFDQVFGPRVQLLEIVGRVVFAVLPIVAEPVDVLLDRVDVLDFFLFGVGVVKPQVAQTAELRRNAKVERD